MHSAAILANGTIVSGNGSYIDTISDAWGSPSISQTSFVPGDSFLAASSDSQTQTVAAVLRNSSGDAGSSVAHPVIRDPDTGAWALLVRPPDATDLANAIEVVVL